MAVFNLNSISRSLVGSSESRRIRKSGMIPAVIYVKGKENNLFISVDRKEFEHEYFKGNIFTTVTDLNLDGKLIKVLPHKVDLNPVTDRPIHIDFIKVEKSKSVKSKVKLKFVGGDKSPGLKKGGFLHIVLRKVELLCNPDSIPQLVEVNVSTLQVGNKVRAGDIVLPDGVSFSDKSNFLICSIIGRGSKEEQSSEATADAVGNTQATTPAAGSSQPQPSGAKTAGPSSKQPASDNKSGAKK